MKISQLDPENKAKALKYQKDEVIKAFSKKTDNLKSAFSWIGTKEGVEYWQNLHYKKTK